MVRINQNGKNRRNPTGSAKNLTHSDAFLTKEFPLTAKDVTFDGEDNCRRNEIRIS